MLKISGLCKSYQQHSVLNGLDMTVKQGEIFGFIGKNGAGKSTTMNIVCGLLPSDGGEIYVNGTLVRPGYCPKLGYLPESPALTGYLNGEEYLTYIAKCCEYQGNIRERNQELLQMVGLIDAADRRIKGYSRGMQQRLGIAAAMYANHDLLILDEPTSALDPMGRLEVIEIIKRLRSLGKTVLLSTHILSDVERIADRVGILHHGTLALCGTMEELHQKFTTGSIIIASKELTNDKISKIHELGYVTQILGQEGLIRVSLSGDFSASNRELFEFISSLGITIQQYEVHNITLEEIYMKVVNEPCN